MSDDQSDDGHRALVARLFPRVQIRTFAPIGTGWTYDTYDVNGEWIVQLPRSAYAADRLRAQIELLPELAHELSALVPVPELVSLDPPAMAYRRLDGAGLDEAPDGYWPERLGRFLYDLHMVPPEIVGLRGRTAETVREDVAAELADMAQRVLPLLEKDERGWFQARFDAYLGEDETWRFAPCLTHGDLGPEHVLVALTGDLVGVLDWEELAVGDPAGDFAWLLHARRPEGERALAAYGGVPDPAFLRRARFAFGLMPFHEVLYGVEAGGEAFVRTGIAGIRERADMTA